MPISIAIGVHGRFHAFDLATALHETTLVRQVATTYPAFAARRFLPPGIALKTAPFLELRRRVYRRTGVGTPPDAAIARRFGKFAARTLPAAFDVFVGWSSASLEAIERAKTLERLAVLERGSTHILHQKAVLERVYDAHGQTFSGIDPVIVERELAEYDAADLIAVPTDHAAETFIARGVPRNRLLINPYGVDAAAYRCGTRPDRDKPVILFVGGVGFRKGAPELIAAFQAIGGTATLRLAGPVEAGWEPPPVDGAEFLGPLSRDRLIEAMASADIFCLPSHEEGLSLSLLQAMAAGLPVVATPESGADEIVEPNVSGLIVPSGNIERLTAALDELVRDRERRLTMGESARATAAEQTWSAYGARAVAAYTSRLSANNGQKN